jgi:small subunit ribosomal protein S14
LAKISVINRNTKRSKIINTFVLKRKEIFVILKDVNADELAKTVAREQLQKLPRDSSPVRYRRRCALTGRPRGVFKKFGLCRIKLREIVMTGQVPGITKASW